MTEEKQEEMNFGETLDIVENDEDDQAPSSIPYTVEDLRGTHVMIAIPMYGGNATGLLTKSLSELHTIFGANGIKLSVNFLFNESLVPRARNYLAENFLANEEFTHLLFIDADIGFKVDDIISLIIFNLKHPKCNDVVAGIYPRKTIAWEKIFKAVKAGVINHPNEMEQFAGDFVFNFKEGKDTFNIYQPLEVAETGTGFMLIPRHVLVKFAEAFPEYRYTPDHLRTPGFDGSKQITAFFHCEIDPKTNRYLSEDYFFCRKIAEIGLKTTILPWINLDHIGNYTYRGDVRLMAQASLDLVSSGKHEE